MRRFSKIRSAIITGASYFKTNFKNLKQTLKAQYDQEKQKGRSKRKSAILGFSTVISVFILKMRRLSLKKFPFKILQNR